MNNILFSVIFLSIIAAQVYILCGFSNNVVKAGRVNNNFHFRLYFRLKSFPDFIRIGDDKILKTSLFKIFKVKGKSMEHCGIKNGQYVFVSSLSEIQRESINTYPVLVFRITGFWNIFDSQFKLRKFVAYISDIESTNWETIYEDFRSRIKQEVPMEVFIDDCSTKSKKIKRVDCKYILSETYDESEKRYRYSLHPVDSVYGRVEYVA